MASYTEYFYQYVENGNTMPNAFGVVPSLNGKSFENIFKEHFNIYEIGLETETLFKERLQAKADVVCPFYADKILKIANAGDMFKVERNFSLSREDKNSSYINTPNINTLNDDNLAGVLKNNIVEMDSETFTPKGKSKPEMIKEFIEIENLYTKLLNEFNDLFLFIW